MNKFEYVSKEQIEQSVLERNYEKGFAYHYLVKDFELPARSTKFSAGYDIRSPFSFVLKPGETISFPLGVKVQLDPDCFLMIVPRSSIGTKYKIMLDNTIAIIDSDYFNNLKNEGEISAQITNWGSEEYIVNNNDKILQGIIVKYRLTENDKSEGIRTGGIGSTGL